MNSSAKRVTRLAVLTAVGVVLLLLANVLPAIRLSALALASFPVCIALMMYGAGWSAGVFAVTALLGFLLFPNVTAIGYAAFFGWYPIVKSLVERPKSRYVVWSLKLAVFTAAFAAYWFLARGLFPGNGALAWYWLYIGGVVVLFVFDWIYSLLIRFYLEKVARFFP